MLNRDFGISYARPDTIVDNSLILPTMLNIISKNQNEKLANLEYLTPVFTYHNIVDEKVYVGDDNWLGVQSEAKQICHSKER